MKVFFAMILFFALTGAAHADGECVDHFTFLCAISYPTMISVGISQFDGKEAYINQVKEDAVDFQVTGEETALLREAILSIRTNTVTDLPDSKIIAGMLQ